MVDERTFVATHWRVVAVNGAATPADGDYHLDFTRNTIGGRFGCNRFGGSYAILGDIITAGDIRSTLMACADPAASFEGHGFAIVRLPMRIQWTSGRKLTLGNSAGSLTLNAVR